jgi:membrane-associated protein
MHFQLIPFVQWIGYPGIFTLIFLESGVIFGVFLPGASLLFTAGLLSSKGYFNPVILIPLVALAATLGDNAGYWFGNKVGIKLFLRPNSRWFKHEHLERAKAFYDRHGTRTVLVARFVPVVRTFVPIIAGIVKMNYRNFVTYNVAGALAWGAGITFLGYYLGEKVPQVQQYFTPIILGIIVITSLPLLWEMRRKH